MQQNLKITFDQLIQFARQSRFANSASRIEDDDDAISSEDTVDLTNTREFDPLPSSETTVDIFEFLNDDDF